MKITIREMRYSVVFYLQSLLVAVFILGISSCKKNDDDGCVDDKVEVVVEGMSLNSVYREPQDGETCQSINPNIPCFIKYKDKDKAKSTALGIEFGGDYNLKRSQKQALLRLQSNNCDVTNYTDQKLTGFTVTSNNAFTNKFPAGTDLSSLLVNAHSRQKVTKEEIKLLGSNFLSFSEDVAGEAIHVLTFTFVLDSVDTMSFNTPPIVLIKE